MYIDNICTKSKPIVYKHYIMVSSTMVGSWINILSFSFRKLVCKNCYQRIRMYMCGIVITKCTLTLYARKVKQYYINITYRMASTSDNHYGRSVDQYPVFSGNVTIYILAVQTSL